MVFAALLSASTDRPGRRSSSSSSVTKKKSKSSLRSQNDGPVSRAHGAASPDYVASEEQLAPLEPPPPDLQELNNALEALAAVFPNIQVEVFREMLSSFDGESRLAVVVDALLKSNTSWVKGRWRVADKNDGNTASSQDIVGVSAGGSQALVPPNEVFRSAEYKDAVKTLAKQEFKGLSGSTINAVLAETNYSYLEARRSLILLSSKSWRFAISAMFTRKKLITSAEAEKHPLVVWITPGTGPATPCLKPTGSAELDRELFDALIAPLRDRAKLAQEQKDRELAHSLNEQEAEDSDAAYECACCFTTAAFEEFTSCEGSGHMICFRCVQHSVSEAVFGQGWQRSIEKATGTLRCPAVESTDCPGLIPRHHIQRAITAGNRGAELLAKFDERLAEHSLLASGLPLIRCPFCDYAEVDDIYVPYSEAQLRLRADNLYNLVFLVLCIGAVPFLLPLVLLASLFAVLLSSQQTVGDYVVAHFRASVARSRRRRRGSKFACGNTARCGAVSCLTCGKRWVDIHVCHESALVALRTQVETAMSMAIKRVCPRCHTSFVKTAGCNKLTCPCGYKMCYVCRRDIGGTGSGNDGADVGYRHFCEHFRPDGDPRRRCDRCSKCNLWEAEDTEAVLRQAREEAERAWRDAEKRELTDAERAFLESGLAVKRPGGGGIGGLLRKGRWPSVADVCDLIVENLVV